MKGRTSYGLIGLGVTDVGRVPGKSVLEFEVEAARRAIEDAGLKSRNIGAAIQAQSDPGGAIRVRHDDSYARVLGLPVKVYMENIGRGGETAAMASVVAMKLLDLGIADYVVISAGKDVWSRSRRNKTQGYRGNHKSAFEKEGAWGKTDGSVTAASFHSLLATRHMAEYGTTSEQFGAVAVSARGWANMNPDATMYQKPMSLEDYNNSPVLIWPYRLYDFSLQSDGGIAFVLTTAERAKDSPHPVYINGVGFGEVLADLWHKKQNYTTFAVETARDDAFHQAGITLTDLDFAQLYDCFTAEVVVQLEDYGWCKKGEGGAFVADGHIAPGGKLPVNTGGGLLSSYHMGNLTGLVEAVRQIRGECGERQLPRASHGIITGHGGEIVSGQMCSVHSTLVLGKEPIR